MVIKPKAELTRVIPFKFTPAQKIFYKDPKQFKVMAKGRRFGATFGEAKWVIKCMLKHPESRSLWVDTTHRNITKYMSRCFLPVLAKLPAGSWEWKAGTKVLTVNSATCDFVSADTPKYIEGFGYGNGGGIVINEAGHILRDRDLWNISILPMIMDGNAWVHLIGTPKGAHEEDADGKVVDTLYYKYFKRGQIEADPNWKSYQFSTYDNAKDAGGYLDRERIQLIVDEQPAEVQPQEIYGKFIDISQSQIFKESWFPIVKELPGEHEILLKVMSLDTAFKTKEESDYSVCLVIYQTRNAYYIVDCICDRFEFPELITETERLYKIYKADAVLIEDRASGQSLIQTLKNYSTMPVLPINPDKDKITRARAITPICNIGKVKLLEGDWNRQFIMQVTGFPCGYADIVDALSQGISYFKDSPVMDKQEFFHESLDLTPNSLRGFEEPVDMRQF